MPEKTHLFATLDRLMREALCSTEDGPAQKRLGYTIFQLKELGVPESVIGNCILQTRRLWNPHYYGFLEYRDMHAYFAEIKEDIWDSLQKQATNG